MLRHGRVAVRGVAPSAAAARTVRSAAPSTAARTMRGAAQCAHKKPGASRGFASAGGQPPRPPAPRPPAPPPPPPPPLPANYAPPPPPLRPQNHMQQHQQQEPPPTFGSTMKTYFSLGIGVSLGVTAFSVLLKMVGF